MLENNKNIKLTYPYYAEASRIVYEKSAFLNKSSTWVWALENWARLNATIQRATIFEARDTWALRVFKSHITTGFSRTITESKTW